MTAEMDEFITVADPGSPTSCSVADLAHLCLAVQVLLGSDHAAADGGEPDHHPRGHHFLQG